MHRTKPSAWILVSALLGCLPLAAQTVKISPTMPYVPVGQQIQFSAAVIGLSPTSVTWYAGGVVGGNATAGRISATGLYTAPATLPGQNPVQITARSTVNKSISATTYVNILSLGPTITSVSPNPLPTGTINVTIQGSGFQPGATVLQTYGSYTEIQLVTTSVTANSITANGYQGPATSAKFCVKNPGSICSNALIVPVGGATPPPAYKLTVVNGTGSGSYAPGSVVNIKANTPPAGEIFSGWAGATVANPSAASTTLTMPAANVTVSASYAPAPSYTLTVVNGSGSGTYSAGTAVTITANAPSAGQAFVNWTGATVANPSAASTALTMPAANTTVTAHFAPVAAYTLTVVNGSGSGSYAAGTLVNISANAPPAGQVFANWTGASVANATSSSTTLTMPAANTTLTANYGPIPTYTLAVVNGTGSGSYTAGTVVNISANALPAGQVFANWTGATVANANLAATSLTMPSANTTVTANYTVVTTIPYPVANHPRLWLTTNDLPRLQSWATSTNPIYQQGMAPLLQQAPRAATTRNRSASPITRNSCPITSPTAWPPITTISATRAC